MSITENKHFSYIHSSIPRVREEIGSLEKRINETFSNVRQHDPNILKFDEELETPRSAIVENYSNVVPKKIKLCSTIRKPSRHKQTSEIETGNFSGWTTEKEESVFLKNWSKSFKQQSHNRANLSSKQIILFLSNPKFRVTKQNHTQSVTKRNSLHYTSIS